MMVLILQKDYSFHYLLENAYLLQFCHCPSQPPATKQRQFTFRMSKCIISKSEYMYTKSPIINCLSQTLV